LRALASLSFSLRVRLVVLFIFSSVICARFNPALNFILK
jgi:hypothetical protein